MEKMIIYGKTILLSYINYVKKFEGHKPGREKRLENDPTIFRYRISFLITVDTCQRILLFISFFMMSFFKVKIPENGSLSNSVGLLSAAASAAAIKKINNYKNI